jgi:hypothetical protein
MRHRAIITLLALMPLGVLAQTASEQEQAILGGIAQCMVAGLPGDWGRAELTVELPQPGANGGEAIYSMTRTLSGTAEPFMPCDERKPAQALVEMRRLQDAERAAWKSARFVIYRDGKFDLRYDYPKKD